MTADGGKQRGQRLTVFAIVGLAVVVLSGLAAGLLGDAAVGALLGALLVAAGLGLFQQRRYARRSAADLAAARRILEATSKQVAVMAKEVAAQSEATTALTKEVTGLSRTVTRWSREVREAEIESGIDALNRYVALGSDDSAHQV
jgi:hypothetical protein